MIDKIKAKMEFKKYVVPYDVNNPKIAIKIAHTYRTADIAEQIAKSLNIGEEDIQLAWLIGLLHDIGRFEQLRIYDTFNDSISIDHGDFGVKLLFTDGLIYQFIEDRKYDQIIYKAIKNHNKYKIEEGLNEKELLHAKIIKDADKTDIFAIHVMDIEDKNNVLYHEEEIKKEIVTPKILENYISHELANWANERNEVDHLVTIISFIYDYNYPKGLEIIKENHYIERILKLLEGCEATKEQTELIKKTALDFLNHR